MSSSILIIAVSIWVVAVQASNITTSYPDCTSTTTLPPLTISTPPGDTEPPTQVVTVTFSEFCPTGLTPKVYTVTEPCMQGQCHPGVATTPPPGFTSAVVVCPTCNSGRPMTEVLTFPISSQSVLSQSSYIINPSGSDLSPAQTGGLSGGSPPGSSQEASSPATISGATGTPNTVVVAAGQNLRLDYPLGILAGLLNIVFWYLE